MSLQQQPKVTFTQNLIQLCTNFVTTQFWILELLLMYITIVQGSVTLNQPRLVSLYILEITKLRFITIV